MVATIFTLLFMLQLAPPPMKGNEAYRSEQYEDAVRLYREAIEETPEESKLIFNLGNALYKSGKKEESIEAFQSFKAAGAEGEEAARADYNIGTMLADEDPEAAIESLISALRQNPGDEDAKHNLEALLKRQQEQQQNQDQQDQDQQNQDQQDEQQDQDQQNQDPNQDQQDEQSSQDPNSQNQQQNPPPPDQQSQQQPRIQPREAEALLDALEQREKDLLRAMKKESEQPTPKTGKDW